MQCTICFRNIDVYAVLPCNHNIFCSECIFKEIALFGNRKCPYCKVEMGNGSETKGNRQDPDIHCNSEENVFGAARRIPIQAQQGV